MLRLRTLLVLIAATAVPVWLWQRADISSSDSPSFSKANIAPAATRTDRLSSPGSTAANNERPTIAPPGALEHGEPARRAAPTVRSASIDLDVHAPASARVGDSITVTIDVEASVAIRALSFTVVYDGRTLEFKSSSPGSFVRQGSAPGTLTAEDPSSGNVLVHMEIGNGGVVAAAGTVVVLEFNALRAGTSAITFREVNFQESSGSSSTASAERTTSITIE